MRLAAVIWLICWGFVGIPWSGVTYPPPMRRVVLVPFRDGRPSGHVLNLLAFVPAGVIGVGLGWPPARVLLVGAGISGATEFSQLFTRRRVASVTDLLLNTAGVGIGIALARRRHGPRPHVSRYSSPL